VRRCFAAVCCFCFCLGCGYLECGDPSPLWLFPFWRGVLEGKRSKAESKSGEGSPHCK
jgi:hypothetical protein